MKFIIVMLILLCTPAYAVQPDEILKDPVLEKHAREISAGLRCLVCQAESIDDSNADFAKDLRVLVRKRLMMGESDIQVRDYLKSRYGDFILLEPPVDARTGFLWLLPLIGLGTGGVIAFLFYRKRVNKI